MSTKADTSRANGAKSNGPVTEQGKAVSARNAEKHGLTSSRVVLPHESEDDYYRLQHSFVARFKPADELESELVQEMVASRWRLRRIESMETSTFRKALREQQELLGPDVDPAEVQDAAYAQVAESKTLRMLARHQGQLRRCYEKAWRELERIQAQRTQEEEETGEACTEIAPSQNEPTRRRESEMERMIHSVMAMPLPQVQRQHRRDGM